MSDAPNGSDDGRKEQAGTGDDCRPAPVAGVSVCVIRVMDGVPHVLMVRRGHAPYAELWSLPGGRVEMGEPVRAAALRELAEETGVAAEIVRLLDVVDIIHRAPDGTVTAHYVLTVFAARWLAGEPRAGSDADEARWIAVPEELETLRTTPGTADLIRRVAADLARAPVAGA